MRNNADHGNFENINEGAAREMLSIVESYLAAHFESHGYFGTRPSLISRRQRAISRMHSSSGLATAVHSRLRGADVRPLALPWFDRRFLDGRLDRAGSRNRVGMPVDDPPAIIFASKDRGHTERHRDDRGRVCCLPSPALEFDDVRQIWRGIFGDPLEADRFAFPQILDRPP
jgi:hypothetical protein